MKIFKPLRAGLSSAAAEAPAPAQSGGSLYRRISRLGDPTVSITPVLDQWVEEGKSLKKEQLHHIIKELRRYGRFKHALEVSYWMTDKMNFSCSASDISTRVGLISKVHGTEEAEKYFENIKEECRHEDAYLNILSCYSRDKSVEKAEAILEKMKDLGMPLTISCCNVILNLYRRSNNLEKFDIILKKMEEMEIKYNKFTFGILLSTYGDAFDAEGLKKVVQKMELVPKEDLDWDAYSIAANGFVKVGLYEKAFEMLKKSEAYIMSKKQSSAYDFLVTQYAAIGKRDEVFRIWELFKQRSKPYNKGYMSIITSLLKFDDLESAEKIFNDWENESLSYDFRIPNFLIGAYCRKGLMEKAEAFIDRAKMKGGKPIPSTFYYLACGYIGRKEMEKALVAMKVAISTCRNGWKPANAYLWACLEYLKEKDDIEEAQEFVELLLKKGVVSADVYEKFLDYMRGSGDFELEDL